MPELTALDRLLATAVQGRASDVHLSADQPPLMRLDGSLMRISGYPDPLSAAWLESSLLAIMGPAQRDIYKVESEVDLAHSVPGVGRFRVNVFHQIGGVAAALRLVPEQVKTLAELVSRRSPATWRCVRGLVLVTGPTGSGKSTTLAAMVDIVNRECPRIITVEDPIEYIHTSQARTDPPARDRLRHPVLRGRPAAHPARTRTSC